MADVVDLAHLLAKLEGFSPLRRVLLATAGTLQGTLSAYFGSPVTIEVVSQTVDDRTIRRTVDLVCKESELVTCRAHTDIDVEDGQIRQLIIERSIGLGQITALLGVRSTFDLESADQDDSTFWRTYRLWGDGFEYRITETFPAGLYDEIVPGPA
jgi:chorismate-pyruvate lyase